MTLGLDVHGHSEGLYIECYSHATYYHKRSPVNSKCLESLLILPRLKQFIRVCSTIIDAQRNMSSFKICVRYYCCPCVFHVTEGAGYPGGADQRADGFSTRAHEKLADVASKIGPYSQ